MNNDLNYYHVDKSWTNIFKVLKGKKKSHSRILNPRRVLFKNERKIETLQSKNTKIFFFRSYFKNIMKRHLELKWKVSRQMRLSDQFSLSIRQRLILMFGGWILKEALQSQGI